MKENVDYKLLFLQEKVNALKHELSFLQSRFGSVQSNMISAQEELQTYHQSIGKETPQLNLFETPEIKKT